MSRDPRTFLPARLGQLLAPALFLLIVLAPLAVVVCECVAGLSAGDQELLRLLVPSGRRLALLGDSLALAGLATVLAVAMGTASSVWIATGAQSWGKRLAESLYLLPLIVPSSLYVLAWLVWVGRGSLADRIWSRLAAGLMARPSPYGFLGSAVVLALVFSPLVTHLVLRGLNSLGPDELAAGQVSRDGWSVFRTIVLPAAWPSVRTGACLVFALSLVEYSVPAMLGQSTLSLEIYAEFSASHDAARALTLAFPVVALAAVLAALTQSSLRHLPVPRRRLAPARLSFDGWPLSGRVFALAGALALGCSALVPLGALADAKAPGALAAAARSGAGDLLTSLTVALATSIISTAIVWTAAAAVLRQDLLGMSTWWVAVVALATPAALTGLGIVKIAAGPMAAIDALRPVIDSIAMLVWGHTARLMPLALVVAVDRQRHLDRTLVDAARLADVSWISRWRWVLLPLSGRGLGAVAATTFLLSLGEVGTSVLVAPPGRSTLAIRIYNLIHYGASGDLAALCLVLTIVVLGVGALLLACPAARER